VCDSLHDDTPTQIDRRRGGDSFFHHRHEFVLFQMESAGKRRVGREYPQIELGNHPLPAVSHLPEMRHDPGRHKLSGHSRVFEQFE